MNSFLLKVIGFATALVLATPLDNHRDTVEARNLSPSACSKVREIVTVLQVNRATPFCSTFLQIGTKTVTSFTTTTATSTVIAGTPTTTVLFLPGDPPVEDKVKHNSVNALHDGHKVKRAENPTLPSYLSAFATSAISSGCSCLSLPTPTTTVTDISTVETTATVPAPTTTETVYPCANGSALYGLASPVQDTVTGGNTLYGSGTTGTSLTGCCNLCFFEVPGCIQAYYYFYEGCVINQVTIAGTYPGVSDVCPNGNIPGLTYSPDMNPPFRSTGDIAGPCGTTYNNL